MSNEPNHPGPSVEDPASGVRRTPSRGERVTAAGPHGSSPVPCSVLDVVLVGDGIDPAAALRQTTELAKFAERCGYHRFWVAEHHSFPASASPAPAVLLAHLGSATSTIRLGSGGVMLTNHAPLLVAEQFGLLDSLHPGRIDLGVGRAPGALPGVAQALGRVEEVDPEDYARQVSELQGFIGRGFPESHPYTRDGVHVVPATPELPVWMLGSGVTGADVAARFGLPFAAAYHINPTQALAALERYRESFQPSDTLAAPYSMISVNVVCAESDEEALRLARPGALMMVWARAGRSTTVPTPEFAENYDYSPAEEEIARRWLDGAVLGSPATVRDGLLELQERTGADELMLTTVVHGFDARLRSYELVAREFDLSGASVAA